MFVFVFVVICTVLYYTYYRRMRKRLYEFANSLPDVGCLPVIGHAHWFIGSPERMLKNLKTLSDLVISAGGIGKMWLGPSLYVVISNPEDVKTVLENCLDKDDTYKFLRVWLGNGLFIAPYAQWKKHRKVLLPIFHNRVVEEYIQIFGEQGSVLAKQLEEQVGKPEFDCFKFITSCTLDIVFETAMGERMDVQHSPDTPYLRARHTAMSIIAMRFFKAWMQPDALFNLTPYPKILKDGIDITHQFTDQVVKRKRTLFEEKSQMMKNGRQVNHKVNSRDMLSLLLEQGNNFSNEELREHIDSITIAGNDTTALVIAYTLVLLGSHQKEQDKVYAQIQSIFGDSMRIPEKEDLDKMYYLERVLKEVMRLYTVVPAIARQTKKEIKLSTCTIPAEVGCLMVPYAMHRCKKIWGPDADTFNPDRFLPENCASRHPCAYIPFSYGPRNCIGRHFGMMAMKSIVANVLRKYKIAARGCDRMKMEILLFPIPGHLITLEKRK